MATLYVGLFLYNALLIGGGRGPFALHNEYWSCHCADLYNSGEQSTSDQDLLRPSLKKGGIAFSDSASAGDDEICHAHRDDSNHVCKRKLPLKYLSILMENAAFTMADSLPMNLKPQLIASRIIPEAPIFLPEGLRPGMNKPPRV